MIALLQSYALTTAIFAYVTDTKDKAIAGLVKKGEDNLKASE